MCATTSPNQEPHIEMHGVQMQTDGLHTNRSWSVMENVLQVRALDSLR